MTKLELYFLFMNYLSGGLISYVATKLCDTWWDWATCVFYMLVVYIGLAVPYQRAVFQQQDLMNAIDQQIEKNEQRQSEPRTERIIVRQI